jgi:hypothetical protein
MADRAPAPKRVEAGVVRVLDLFAWCFGKRFDPNKKACLGCPRVRECYRATKEEKAR